VNEKIRGSMENVYLNESGLYQYPAKMVQNGHQSEDDVGYYTNAELVVFIKLALLTFRKRRVARADKMKKPSSSILMQCRLPEGDNDDLAWELCLTVYLLDIAHEF
jgi:hypothetical protein